MPEAKGVLEGLMDFSFRLYATPRMLKFLYALHLLMGLIAGVAWVVLAFQQAPVQGLLALLAALVGYFLWILYCRVVLEVLAAVFRMADAIAPDRGSSQQQQPRCTTLGTRKPLRNWVPKSPTKHTCMLLIKRVTRTGRSGFGKELFRSTGSNSRS